MLVKILDADDKFVEHLKVVTGATTASKAYSYAAEHHHGLRLQVTDLLNQVAALNRQLMVQDQVIERARFAAKGLLDHVSQSSLEL